MISWNATIARYAQNTFVKDLETFSQMRLAGVNLDFVTFTSVLPTCAKMGSLEQGMDMQSQINFIENRPQKLTSFLLGSSLVLMKFQL